MNRHPRIIAAALSVVLSGGVLSACGSSSGHSSPGASGTTPATAASSCKSPTSFTFRLNWIQDYEQVPYYVALNKGFYRDQC
ncbi:MAG TPA: hypothetical protein VFN68_11640, partial [Acidimicrobiales bacterium]|nr:hypothetical protein [Acidimicrobiales bacterium]